MVNRRKREYLTQDEIDRLLAAAKTASRNPERDYCLLLLMFRHGLRVSEACSLKLSDIDLENKLFHVRRLKGCDHGVHDFYNGESVAIRDWLIARANESVGGARGVIHQRAAEAHVANHSLSTGACYRRGGRARAPGYPSAYAAPQLRLRADPENRRAGGAGLSWAPEHQLDGSVHEAEQEPVCEAFLSCPVS